MNNTCDNCGHTFANKGNLSRHIKNRICIRDGKEQKSLSYIASLSNKIRNLEQKIEEISKQKDREINELKKQLKNTATTSIVHNGTGNINIQNQTIVVFGKEDLNDIDYEKVKFILLNDPPEFVPNMIREIHNNDRYPQYRNIGVNPRDGNVEYFDGEWRPAQMPELMKTLNDKVINENMRNKIASQVSNPEEAMKFPSSLLKIKKLDGNNIEHKKKLCSILPVKE